ncbi:MAG: hypothetical protein LBJ32_04440 [Oscillospiraceae bacterium]|jgi:hypothetical protein|nr:hypothetical protein [Oscillospiraceae bacterium]
MEENRTDNKKGEERERGGAPDIITKIRFKKIKNLKKNFSKILAVILAILNLFASDLSVKALEKNDANNKLSISEKNIGESKKVLSKKYTSIGIAAFLSAFFGIKKIRKKLEEEAKRKSIEEEEAKQREVQPKNAEQWFKSFNTRLDVQNEIIEKIKKNTANTKELEEFVNFYLEIIELARQYINFFQAELIFEIHPSIKSEEKISPYDIIKVTVRNTGAIIRILWNYPFIKFENNFKTAEQALKYLKTPFSFLSIIFELLECRFQKYYFYHIGVISNSSDCSSCEPPFRTSAFQIVNGELMECYGFSRGKKIKPCNNASGLKNFLVNLRLTNTLKCLGTLEQNLKNLSITQKNDNILKLLRNSTWVPTYLKLY